MAENLLITDERFDVVRDILSIRERALDLVKSAKDSDYQGAENGPCDLILSDPGLPDTGGSKHVELIFEDRDTPHDRCPRPF